MRLIQRACMLNVGHAQWQCEPFAAQASQWQCMHAGHVPMLADPVFCELVHAIGLASLAADESQIWDLTKIYWFTVEFGVVKEMGDIKAFGAGGLCCLRRAPQRACSRLISA